MSKFLDENGLSFLWTKIKTLLSSAISNVTGKFDEYLPLSGGTIKGDLIVDYVNEDSDDTTGGTITAKNFKSSWSRDKSYGYINMGGQSIRSHTRGALGSTSDLTIDPTTITLESDSTSINWDDDDSIGTKSSTTITSRSVTTDEFIKKDSTSSELLAGDGSVKAIGTANGVASLDANGNVPLSQLGNLDTTVAEVVAALPTTDIKKHIYMIKSDTSTAEQNIYKEYIYTGDTLAAYDASKWEQLGEYKSDVDLSEYAKKSEALKSISAGTALEDYMTINYTKADGTNGSFKLKAANNTVSGGGAGIMSVSDKQKLDNIDAGNIAYVTKTNTFKANQNFTDGLTVVGNIGTASGGSFNIGGVRSITKYRNGKDDEVWNTNGGVVDLSDINNKLAPIKYDSENEELTIDADFSINATNITTGAVLYLTGGISNKGFFETKYIEKNIDGKYFVVENGDGEDVQSPTSLFASDGSLYDASNVAKINESNIFTQEQNINGNLYILKGNSLRVCGTDNMGGSLYVEGTGSIRSMVLSCADGINTTTPTLKIKNSSKTTNYIATYETANQSPTTLFATDGSLFDASNVTQYYTSTRDKFIADSDDITLQKCLYASAIVGKRKESDDETSPKELILYGEGDNKNTGKSSIVANQNLRLNSTNRVVINEHIVASDFENIFEVNAKNNESILQVWYDADTPEGCYTDIKGRMSFNGIDKANTFNVKDYDDINILGNNSFVVSTGTSIYTGYALGIEENKIRFLYNNDTRFSVDANNVKLRTSANNSVRLTEGEGFKVFTNLYAEPDHVSDVTNMTDAEKQLLSDNTVQKLFVDMYRGNSGIIEAITNAEINVLFY